MMVRRPLLLVLTFPSDITHNGGPVLAQGRRRELEVGTA